MNTSWRIELLGGLRAVNGEQVLTNFETRKAAALLAYLALHRHRTHSREVLTEKLWPDQDDVTTDRFRQALSAIRRALEPAGSGMVGVVIADRAEVGLNPTSVTTDVAEFEAALKAAERAPNSEERVIHLEQALTSYGGELLPGFYEDWILPERERLEETFLQALGRMAGTLEERGDLSGAIEHVRRLVQGDPLREDAQGELIRLYLLAGRRAEGLRQYKELERMLQKDWGVTPSAQTRALLSQMQADPVVPVPITNVPTEGRSPPSVPFRIDPVGGAVPLDSQYYIIRPTDAEFEDAVERGDSIVLVKGARQIGKTSLLARGVQHARQAGTKVVLTDLQKLTAEQIQSPDSLFFTLAEIIVEQLELEVSVDAVWDSKRGWNINVERFFRREVLKKLEAPLVWGLDEVDRLFGHPYHAEVFGLFRSWHNERSLNPEGPWGRLTLAMAYATEAHLFITDLNQSPFNVGTRLTLEDFTPGEVSELNRRYRAPLREEGEIARFIQMVGGHPYLAQRGLHAMVSHGLDVAALEAQVAQDEGLFGDHLHRMLVALRQDAGLCETVRGVLRGQPCSDISHFYRLRSAGVLAGRSLQEAQLRCGLYRRFLEQHLI